jgi:hypothetical protein
MYGWLFIAYTVALVPVSMLWYRVGQTNGREDAERACSVMLAELPKHASWCGVRFQEVCDCPVNGPTMRAYKRRHFNG